MNKVIIIGYLGYQKNTTRGICVLADYFVECGYKVDYYQFPVYLYMKEFWVKKIANTSSQLAEKTYRVLIPYSTKFPLVIKRVFLSLFEYSHSRKLKMILKHHEYSVIVIESGKEVFLYKVLEKFENKVYKIYRQSDPVELGIDSFLSNHERKLISVSDITLVANNKILDYYKDIGFGDKVKLWENGISLPCYVLKNPYKHAKNILYFGLFPIDHDLIRNIAEHNRDTSIHIIGPYEDLENDIKGCNNVYLYGTLPYADILPYIKYADICILPYKNDGRLSFMGTTSKVLLFMYFDRYILALKNAVDQSNNYDKLVILNNVDEINDEIQRIFSCEKISYEKTNQLEERYLNPKSELKKILSSL